MVENNVPNEELEVKKKSKKKKSKVKVRYVKPAPISKDYLKLDVFKLKENMIETGDLKFIYTKSDKGIEIRHNWIELCLLLLGNIHINNKDKFIRILLDYNVISNDFNVTATREYYLDRTNKRDYKIPASPFWLITTMECRAIKKAILNMCSALDIVDSLKLDIVPKGKEVVRLLDSGEYMAKGISEKVDNTFKINSISIFGTRYAVNSHEGAVMVFLEVLRAIHGNGIFREIMTCNTTGIGISDNKDIEVMHIYDLFDEEYKDKRYYLYNNDRIKDSLKFIENVIGKLEVGYVNVIIGISAKS